MRDRSNPITFTVVQATEHGASPWQTWVGADAMPRAKRHVAALRAALPGRTFWIQAKIVPRAL